ncbi:MAG: hypothetical protein ACE5E9_01535 [Nitrospinaceae bacterium]
MLRLGVMARPMGIEDPPRHPGPQDRGYPTKKRVIIKHEIGRGKPGTGRQRLGPIFQRERERKPGSRVSRYIIG